MRPETAASLMVFAVCVGLSLFLPWWGWTLATCLVGYGALCDVRKEMVR